MRASSRAFDPGRHFLPRTGLGRAALAATGVALASWVVLPMITVAFRETVPVTDTAVMPAIGLVLTLAAAVLNVMALWRARDRATSLVIAAVLTVPLALFTALVLVGGGLNGR